MRLRSVTVGPDVVEAVVQFEDGEPSRTSEAPGVGERVLAALPGLRGHRCDNLRGASFADELPDTEIAHLLEHAALEIMALSGSPDTLHGETVWDFRTDGRGVFRVRLEYDDDLVCLGAIGAADRVVRRAMGGDETIDVAAETGALREARRR